ncbi:hypothetical protein ANO11243_074240 [Dothideomycetidae sp. 11243]|nr:hypothetical protein ANO11243_074240 [fungal sp. No.11243]
MRISGCIKHDAHRVSEDDWAERQLLPTEMLDVIGAARLTAIGRRRGFRLHVAVTALEPPPLISHLTFARVNLIPLEALPAAGARLRRHVLNEITASPRVFGAAVCRAVAVLSLTGRSSGSE